MSTFAIIGGGAAGVSTLYQLVEFILKRKTDQKVTILVIEKSDMVGPGLAYSKMADDTYLLNLPFSKMSPIPGQPDHFSKWLKNENNLPKWRPAFPLLDLNKTEYPPRRLFGIYLADLAIEIQKKAINNGIEVKFIQDEVVNVIPGHQGGLQIQLINKKENLYVDSAVLCIGHLPPSQSNFQQFKSVKGYYETPWEIKLDDIAIEKDFLVLGTRLSAIDAILARASYIKNRIQAGYQGPIGKIIAASRTGLPPRVISDTKKDYVRNELTLEAIDAATAYGTQFITFKELKKLFKAEIKRAYKEMNNQEITFKLSDVLNDSANKDPISWLEHEIESAKKHKKRPWQTVLFSLYPVVPRLWEALDEDGKKEFLDNYYSYWMTYLAAFPLENAEKILALLKNGQLEIHKGLDNLSYHQKTGEFELQLKEGKSLKSTYVVNAAGQGHDITQTNSLLLQNLLANELIKPHPFGGVEVDFKSLRAIGKYKHTPIFIVGDPTWGACMATADLYQIANNQVPRVINSMLSPQKKKHNFSSLLQENGLFTNPIKINNLSKINTVQEDEILATSASSPSFGISLSQSP